MWVLILVLLATPAYAQLSKIDDETVSITITKNFKLVDLKVQLANVERQINDNNSFIQDYTNKVNAKNAELNTLADELRNQVQQAEQLGVKEKLDVVEVGGVE